MISIITGGQTGVDHAGTMAAFHGKIPFKVIMPKDYKREAPFNMGTTTGKVPIWLAPHVQCLKTDRYDERTKEVMRQATAVLTIPGEVMTPGTRLTLDLATKQGKQQWLFQNLNNPAYHKAEAHAIAYWLRSLEALHGDVTLMIAGPRESKCPGIEVKAYQPLYAMAMAIVCDKPQVAPDRDPPKKGKKRESRVAE